jgi:hypothetical protein
MVFFLAVTLFAPASSQADTVTVSLIVDPNSVISHDWNAGDLVEVTVQATSDGDPNQGFAGGDFGSGSFGISVDANCLKLHDVKAFVTIQVDTQTNANTFNGLWPASGYLKANDTWVYDYFTDFLDLDPNSPGVTNIILTDTLMRTIPSVVLGELNLGRGTPVDFLHIVLEVQAGLTPNSSTSVTFYGQMGALGVAQEDIDSNMFGSIGGDVNTGSFSVANVPEPASVALLLAGSLLLSARRRLRAQVPKK